MAKKKTEDSNGTHPTATANGDVELRRELRAVEVDILTLGQYLRPSDGHIPLDRYYTPDEFRHLRDAGLAMGFRHVESGPLVRSSYHAWEQVQEAGFAERG